MKVDQVSILGFKIFGNNTIHFYRERRERENTENIFYPKNCLWQKVTSTLIRWEANFINEISQFEEMNFFFNKLQLCQTC